MGLLGDGNEPTTTGATGTTGAVPQSAPYTVSPEASAYAQAGVDPRLIEQAGWDSIGRMGMVLMAAGGPGVDSSNLGAQLAQASQNDYSSVKNILAARRASLDEQLDRAKLTMAQNELLLRQRAEARETSLNRALGLDLSGDTGATPAPSIAAASGVPATPAPTTAPLPPGLDVSDLPGYNGNPRLAVTGTGAGQTVEPGLVAPAPQAAPAVAPTNSSPLAIAAGVFRGDPAIIARLGLSPEQAALLRITAASGPEGRSKAINEIIQISQKPRYTSESNDNGTIITTDQYGNKNAVQAPTQGQILSLERGKQDIQSQAQEAQAQANFNRERQKAAEDSVRAEDAKNREAALALSNKALADGYKSAQASKDVLEKTNIAEELMREGVFSGGAAQMAVGSARATLSKYGLWDDRYAQDAQARTVALQNLGREIALSMAKALRPTTDKDVEFAQKVAGLDPSQYDTKTMRELLRISRAGHERSIADYNSSVDRARKPYEIAGDQRSLAAADAAYPKLDVPVRLPNQRKTINGRTFEFDGNGWLEVR